MADRPIGTGEWGNAGSEPNSAKKATGFLAGDKLQAAFLNWMWNLSSRWFAWITQYFVSGRTIGSIDNVDFYVSGRNGPAGTDQDGGNLILRSGETTGSEGAGVYIQATTPGVSGSDVNTPETYIVCGEQDKVVIRKELNAWTDIDINTPNKLVADIVNAHNSASGTDQDGYDLTLAGGSTTGNQSTSVSLRAATAGTSGSDVRTPEDYLVCNGSLNKIFSYKDTDIAQGKNLYVETALAHDCPSGVDQAGEHLILSSGTATGTGFSSVYLKAVEGGASGSDLRTGQNYIICDGGSKNIRVTKDIVRDPGLYTTLRISALQATVNGDNIAHQDGQIVSIFNNPYNINFPLPNNCNLRRVKLFCGTGTNTTISRISISKRVDTSNTSLEVSTSIEVNVNVNTNYGAFYNKDFTSSPINIPYNNLCYLTAFALTTATTDTLYVYHLELEVEFLDLTPFRLN